MSKLKNMREELFLQRLHANLDEQPQRDPSAVSEGKARFLAQAKMYQNSPVTNTPAQRHKQWNLSHLKEVKMGTLITIVVILGLALGGTSAVYAAQDDLPGEPLYQVKLLSEEARLALAADPEKKMDLDLQFAMMRLDEIEAMIEAGLEPPDMSYARLENQLMQTIGQATLLDEEAVPGALLRIRQTIQERMRLQDSELENPLQTRLRTLLQTRLSWLEEGVVDPERFTNEYRLGWESTATEEPGTITPNEMPGPGYKTPGPGYKTPGPGYQTPGPGYQTPGPGYETPEPDDNASEPGYQTPEPGGETPGEGSGNSNGNGTGGKNP